MCARPTSILVVDDDEDTRFLLCSMLKKRGFAAHSVAGANACLEALTTTPAAVVITDVQMPGMSGLELCGVLRERHPAVRTIVMSGLASTATMTAALARGACRFLSKPITYATLEQTLAQVLAERPPPS